MEHIWLVTLFFVAFPLLFTPGVDARDWGITAALIGAFLVFYVWSVRSRESGALGPMVAVTILGTAGAYLNSGATVFLIFVSAFVAYRFAPRIAVRLIGALAVLVVVIGVTIPAQFPYGFASVSPAFLFVIVIGLANVFEAQRARANARLRMAQEEIEHLATLAERERIARDLHDLLGHTLSVIVLKAELASRLMSRDPERAATEVAEVERISRTALAEVRAAVQGYRGRTLAGELEGARSALAAAGIAVEIEMDPIELPEPREEVLALAVREAVTNVLRHAAARSVRIQVTSERRGVRLTVIDDGRGGVAPDGSGLRGMRERLAAFGGSVERDGRSGTRLAIRLPIPA